MLPQGFEYRLLLKIQYELYKNPFTADGGDHHRHRLKTDDNKISFGDSTVRLHQSSDGWLIIANSMDSALPVTIQNAPDMRITLADWGATERLRNLAARLWRSHRGPVI
ncbi:MAG: hypothetical protein H6963_11635 [Chromatiaceae bacterium]|nr:hypothetical protein [Chromatiaceae bacterium]